ncbi:MAG: DUF2802 domain-containing protein [Gammaproteobacteria bacterium]|nr:DUF2802 domain-containing protein [Gammaproteobacteria bacterium]MBU1415730.1 DUF2802 domain-containing protein [Gammaproteobacteria bacterium]
MESGGFGWRELTALLAALAGVYLVIALVALARLRSRSFPAGNVEPTASRSLVADAPPPAERSWAHPFLTPAPKPDEDVPVLTEVDLMMGEVPSAKRESPFAETLALTGLESEVRQLRGEVAALREELAELKEARRISPLYADAAALAHRGFDARGVAEECGISVAEAELVLAMSKDETNFDSEVHDDPDGRKQGN